MNLVKRLLIGIGATALIAPLFILFTPKTAHALVAALVQVTNTVSAPAITQGVPNLASQNVMLFTLVSDSQASNPMFQLFPSGAESGSPYSVPAGQSLVITSIESINKNPVTTSFLGLCNFTTLANYVYWNNAPHDSVQETFPSGIVIGSGVTPGVNDLAPDLRGTIVFVQGYLTAN